jgi:hypothetical protein
MYWYTYRKTMQYYAVIKIFNNLPPNVKNLMHAGITKDFDCVNHYLLLSKPRFYYI